MDNGIQVHRGDGSDDKQSASLYQGILAALLTNLIRLEKNPVAI